MHRNESINGIFAYREGSSSEMLATNNILPPDEYEVRTEDKTSRLQMIDLFFFILR
jgi:hypothetical protein